MSRFYSHANTAKQLLQQYNGQEPFSNFLKKFFSKEKKFGSRDRKSISSLCYNYFRLGFALQDKTIEEKILVCQFLFTTTPNEWMEIERPEWNSKITASFAEKLRLIPLKVERIFPFNNDLCADINPDLFDASFLIQPDVFIRIRPGNEDIVKKKLTDANIHFDEWSEHCFGFENGTKLEDLLHINLEAVIQDANSQRVGELFQQMNLPGSARVWDCCAASGGKAIMLCDAFSRIQLTVSDVRETIIHNLNKRFTAADIKGYKSFIADLQIEEEVNSILKKTTFDLIICDAPCSGSGTWSRTPEQLVYFKAEEIERYSVLQKNITSNTIQYLKKGGYFLYITCSVFQKENEDIVSFILKNPDITLIKKELFKGYEMKADSMFVALFKRT